MRRLIALAALAGCDEGLEPPVVLEPAEGTVVDRVQARVQASSPDDLYDSGLGSGEFSSAIRGHVNWRIDGGLSVGVQFPTMTRDDVAPFLFGITLEVGDNELEVGACDKLDACAWTARHVTVSPRSGSPDPGFARTGQLVLVDQGRTVFPTPLTDGRVLLGIDDLALGSTLVALRPDGTRDPAFGDDGVAVLSGYLGSRFRVLPQPDGALVVVLEDRVVKLTAAGARDGTFGVDGIATLAPPIGAISKLHAVAARTGGGFTLAGVTQRDPLDFSDLEDFVAVIDDAGAQLDYDVLDPVGGLVRSTDVDADGVVIRLGPTDLTLVDASGGVTTLTRPAGATDARFHDGGLAIAQRDGTALRVTLTAGPSTVDLPFDAGLSVDPLLATAPDGVLYVAGAIAHPRESTSLVDDGIDGSDLAVLRIIAGSVDASFGDDGVAHASFMNARTPIVLETILDRAITLVVGPDGEPWVSGLSLGIETPERDWLRDVETRAVLVRFLP